MKIRKLGIIVETPMSQITYIRYGIDYLRTVGYTVQVFDCSAFLNPSAFTNIKMNLADYDKNGFIRCLTPSAAKEAILYFADKNTIFGINGPYNLLMYPIYKSISNSKCPFFYFLQDTNLELDCTSRMRVYFKKISLKRIIESIFVRLPHKIIGLHGADFVLLGGSAYTNLYIKYRLCDAGTQIKYIHSRDFDDCIRYRHSNQKLVRGRYCVFLDQYHPYHPDCLDLGFKIDSDLYYKQLRDMFGFIQDKLNVQVIVAAHPRSNYNIHPDSYRGYDVIINRTCELVKDAEFVFTHTSSSAVYAFIYKKPFFSIHINALENEIYLMELENAFAKEYHCKTIDATDFSESNVKNIQRQLVLDDEWYTIFIKRQLKENYADTLDTPLFCEELNQYILERYNE